MTLLQLTKKHFLVHLMRCNNIVEINSGKTPKSYSKMSLGKSKQKVLGDILNAYKTHPSIKQIEKKFNEQNFFRKENFFFKPVTPSEIKSLINCLDRKNPAEIDTVPSKLIKIAAENLTALLTVAINKSIDENIFPDK